MKRGARRLMAALAAAVSAVASATVMGSCRVAVTRAPGIREALSSAGVGAAGRARYSL